MPRAVAPPPPLSFHVLFVAVPLPPPRAAAHAVLPIFSFSRAAATMLASAADSRRQMAAVYSL
jgi:hypothetical protein